MSIRIQTLAVDTADPSPIATRWADALGWRITHESDDEWGIESARLVDLGVRQVDVGQSGHDSWIVMADPEGNGFCILGALATDELEQ